jgi:hypothetical protein
MPEKDIILELIKNNAILNSLSTDLSEMKFQPAVKPLYNLSNDVVNANNPLAGLIASL